ncbi:hypothetical protein [Curtobacterium sp. NPDC089689]|uniref:hypothetical protein n=1 Tax=Curtobacterium sp. NPDC089689 TaxID=3363968 RepID=UPI00382BB063
MCDDDGPFLHVDLDEAQPHVHGVVVVDVDDRRGPELGQDDVIVHALAAARAGTTVPFVIESEGEITGRIT